MKVLYIQPGQGMGGSHISLFHMLKCAPPEQESFVALSSPPQLDFESLIKEYVKGTFYLDLPTWQKFMRRNLKEKIRAPSSHAFRLVKLFPAARKLKDIIAEEKIDLVHTNNSICAAGAFAAWKVGIPHVWHIRESFGSDRQYKPILGNKITYWLMKKWSKAIICNSNYTAEPFKKNNIPHIIIQNGIDLDLFGEREENGKTLKSKFGIKESTLVVGMVGNLTAELKKHNEFLEMAALILAVIKDIKFIVFGGSNDLDQTSYTRKLAEQVKLLKIGNNVAWADFISDTAAMMHSVDILVHPASTEGSGRVVMEAMAAGKPVVAINSGGVRELIQDGLTGFLIQSGDIMAMTQKVKGLVENEDLRKVIGANARCYAQDHFSDQASMNAILAVYHDLVYHHSVG